MLPSEFIQRHSLNFSKNELELSKEAIDMMVDSLDVHHNETHAYRLLDYLDKFMGTKEFENISNQVDLKSFFIAILWHDVWKSERDPSNVFLLMRDILLEGVGAARKFGKYAKKYNLKTDVYKKARYAIRKHSLIQIAPLMTWEAKILSDIDALDGLSLDRIYYVEKKYLYDRPVTPTNLRMARFAVRMFVKNKTERSFFLEWSKKIFVKMRKDFLDKASIELYEYEQLVKISKSQQEEEFENYLCFMREKYINRPEEERTGDPF
jgi:hypothetical protein